MSLDIVPLEEIERDAAEFIPKRLYFASFQGVPPSSPDVYCFSVDNKLVYEGFCLDFGPLNLGQTYRFCALLSNILQDEKHEKKKIYFYSGIKTDLRTNAATLICAFSVLCLGMTPDEAFRPLEDRRDLLRNFHDASYFPCPYVLTVKDCIDGLYRAKQLNWFSWPNFNVEEYEHYCDLEHGDLNWLVEGKFLAFAGPFEERKHYGHGYYSSVPQDFIEYFKEKNVTAVIRLNKPFYDAKHFTENGINHYHLFYPDGGNPPRHILQRFIDICEKEKGAIAVHCKAGLGRTGTCIAMYLMKHYNVTAKELIGWFRITRPGSVIGPQQDFLELHEKEMHEEGKAFRKEQTQSRKQRGSRLAIDQKKSFTSVKLVNRDDLYVNLLVKGAPNLRLSTMSDVFVDEAETTTQTSDIDIDPVNDTQGDILNKLKAQHRHHHKG